MLFQSGKSDVRTDKPEREANDPIAVCYSSSPFLAPDNLLVVQSSAQRASCSSRRWRGLSLDSFDSGQWRPEPMRRQQGGIVKHGLVHAVAQERHCGCRDRIHAAQSEKGRLEGAL